MEIGNTATGQETNKKPAGCGIGCLSVIAVLIAIGVASSIFGGSSSKSSDTLSEILAQNACQKAVEAHLKAPSTAKFPAIRASGSGTKWSVSGQVDSENSFGAMLRNDFTCDVSVVNERATVKNVSF